MMGQKQVIHNRTAPTYICEKSLFLLGLACVSMVKHGGSILSKRRQGSVIFSLLLCYLVDLLYVLLVHYVYSYTACTKGPYA